MINVVFLGFGNVNSHLFTTLHKSNQITVKQVFNRNYIKMISPFEKIPFTDDISKVEAADVYIIGIPDDAILSFSEALSFQNKLVVHTSGGVAMNVLSSKNRRGIFYPLQTFSKQRAVDFKDVPICIEAENSNDLELLRSLGETISEKVVEISSEKRAKLHLAAVFVNNFTNYLYEIGSEILKQEDLPFNLLKPLIIETASKIETLSPQEAQTGPAKRNDVRTIEKHLHLLGDSQYRKFYELFTEELKQNYGKKL
ncbi:protein of unknown function (DUF2520) [Aequorivita sublithincola DSM 14238]|uniref:DUF2520 domain-containing protein n=1 Tax=Aequorivita sublithincola (strain DSM 14238 / LMG 21431 / ACAM 643 / 9-3) TaxID=746697 RepID=I3YZK9_AEQSU|nr:DUF2520 domain-containing protein [Aequorivita sublithincola]AFL82427.1 protein of unknown function (DUF2520) [Aequorivita sublithincola DSM 14238]